MESESNIDYLNLSGCYPEWDEFSLLVCDICGTIIRPQAFEKHLKIKHQIGVQVAAPLPPPPPPISTTTPTPKSTTTTSITNNLQPQKRQQISLPAKLQLDQQQTQPQVQEQPPQKITINPPPPTIDRKPIITARTTITTVPNIKPTTIKATTAIKTTTNSNNNISNGEATNHVLKSSKPVKRPAPSANISITTTKQTNHLSANAAVAPPPVKTKPKTKTKATSKTQQSLASSNGKTTKNSNASNIGLQPPKPATTILPSRTDFFDPSFYGLEPLSPPSSAIGGPLSSSSASSTSSSASSSSSTSSGSSTNSSLSYCTSLSNHNNHRNVISLPLNGSANQLPPAFLSKYQDRKWRNTYNVLRDAFF